MDSLRFSVDKEEMEDTECKEWELEIPLLPNTATNSDLEFKDQKSSLNSCQNQSPPDEKLISYYEKDFRSDFFEIENTKLLNGNGEIIIEIGNKILDLDDRARGCCVAPSTQRILIAKRDELIKLFYQFKVVLNAKNSVEGVTTQQLSSLKTCIQQCINHRAMDTFCYRLGTSPYALFSRRQITTTRELLNKANKVLPKLNTPR